MGPLRPIGYKEKAVMAVNFEFLISDTFRKYTGYNYFVIVVEIPLHESF